MTRLGGGARCHPASAQGPTFAERRAVADLDRHAEATRIQFCPERIGLVERDRVLRVIVRSEHVHRFTGREYTTAHVALLTRMVSRPKNFLEHVSPILHRLIIDLHDDMLNNRRSDPFVGEGKVNGPIAAVEFEDGPHRSTHLLALHVGGISGNTQSTESDKGCDDCVISAGPTRLRLFRHDGDLIAGWVCVNRAAGPSSSVQLNSRSFMRPANVKCKIRPGLRPIFSLLVAPCSMLLAPPLRGCAISSVGDKLSE
jgi:hypothetical protein